MGPAPGWTLIGHGTTALAWSGALGALVAAVLRAVIVGTGAGARAGRIQRLTIVPFLLTFPLFVVLPTVLLDQAPRWVAALGLAGPRWLYLLQAPAAVADSIGRGAWWVTLTWGGTATLAAALAGRAVWRWRGSALADLPIDLHAIRVPRYVSAFSALGRLGGAWPAGATIARLFWTKDVALPVRRDPLSYLQGQVIPVAALLAGLVVASRLGGPQSGPGHTLAFEAALLFGVGWTAAGRSLGSLGEEGEGIALLRPLVSPARLFQGKVLGAALFGVSHAVAYVVLVLLGGRAVGLPAPDVPLLAAEAVAAGLLFSILGTSLGFLLPGLERGGGVPPGASLAAKTLYAMVGGATGSIYLVARSLKSAGALSGAHLSAVVGVLVVCVGGGATLLAGWALPWSNRMEP